MNREFKRYIFIIGAIWVIFLVGAVILHILPWLLLAGVIAYVVMKIVGIVKGKKKSSTFDNSNEKEYIHKDIIDDYSDGEIIDVEYEDIDDKRD